MVIIWLGIICGVAIEIFIIVMIFAIKRNLDKIVMSIEYIEKVIRTEYKEYLEKQTQKEYKEYLEKKTQGELDK